MRDEDRDARGGFDYRVNDEQPVAFGRLSDYQCLPWLDAARRLTLMAATRETRASMQRLRRGGVPEPTHADL